MAHQSLHSSIPVASSRQGFVTRYFFHIVSFELFFALFLASNAFELATGTSVDTTPIILLISIAFGILVIIREGIYKPGLLVTACGILLIIWIWITYSWTPSVTLSKERVLRVTTVNLWCIMAGSLILANNRARMVRFMICLLVFGFLTATYGIYVFLYFEGGVQRYSDEMRAYITWGRVVAPAAIISFAMVLFSKPFSTRQYLALGLFVYTVFYLLAAGGRGAFLAAVLGFMLPMATGLKIGRNDIKLPMFQVLTIVMILIGIAGMAYLFVSGEAATALERIARTFQKDASFKTSANRLVYWPTAVQYWYQAPFFGHGVASFPIMFRGGWEDPGAYPHNLILETLTELGLVGFALLSSIFWAATRRGGLSLNRLRKDPLQLCVAMLCISAFINAMVSHHMATNLQVFIFIPALIMRPPHNYQ